MSHRRQPRSFCSRGFTLIESLVVIAIFGVVLLIGMPNMMGIFQRWRLLGDARQVAQLLRLARLEAIKHSQPVCVTQSFADNTVNMFLDPQGADALGDGDCVFQAVATPTQPADRIFTAPHRLTGSIEFIGPGDVLPSHANAVSGFATNAGGEALIRVRGDGSVNVLGSLRVGDGKNFFEARVANRLTGRVVIQKYLGPNPTDWYEQDEQGKKWTWN
jgi:prepilin-type N-terminal cleavage/methylation domain-containing protein